MKRIRFSLPDKGFVSIVVCIILAGILTVIATSFVAIVIREQRQALDRQLNSQAFYAAESGVNYAIKAGINSPSTCVNGNVGNARFTCLLTNNAPDELIYDNVDTNNPTVFFFQETTNTLTQLQLAWQNSGGTAGAYRNYVNDFNCGAICPKFYPIARGDGLPTVGVLEVTIYPLGSAASFAINTVKSNSRTFYFYPTDDNTAVSTDWSADGAIGKGNCASTNTPKVCRALITSVPGSTNTSGFVVRLRAIYNDLSVQINGQKVSGGLINLPLTGAQKLVDSTARANDVLRRISVRVPLRAAFDLPSFAIETGEELCKRQAVTFNSGTDDPQCL